MFFLSLEARFKEKDVRMREMEAGDEWLEVHYKKTYLSSTPLITDGR